MVYKGREKERRREKDERVGKREVGKKRGWDKVRERKIMKIE